MSVNKDRVRLLVDALRSGEYQQGIAFLNRNSKFCCLGVACEVAIKHGVPLVRNPIVVPTQKGAMVERVEVISYGTTDEMARTENGPSETVLPKSVMEWYGFNTPIPTLRYISATDNETYRTGAAELNDSYRFNFNEIADCFEKTFLETETHDKPEYPQLPERGTE